MTLTNLSLFSGAGGLDLGARLVGGFRTVAYVEYDRYAQGVLMSRMRSGDLDDAPIFEDVRTFDGRRLRGSVDVVSGGFPCQDVSVAGKRAGIIEGKRSGLWSDFARIIREVGPRFVLVENVAGLLANGGIGVVLGDLAAMGFDAEWYVLSAAEVGAPHRRERVWIVAYAERVRLHWRYAMGCCRKVQRAGKQDTSVWCSRGIVSESSGPNERVEGAKIVADTQCLGLQGRNEQFPEQKTGVVTKICGCGRRHDHWTSWGSEPCVGRVDYGVAFAVDRLRCTGNGVVPQQAAPAWQRIKDLAGEI